MCKYISFGKYNKLYKYIWYYIFIRLIFEIFFNSSLIRIQYFEVQSYPKNILIQQVFNYFFVLIFSLIFYMYQKSKIKEKASSKINSKYQITYIYNNDLRFQKISVINFIIIIILVILSDQMKIIFVQLGFKGLDFWMLEILFVYNAINIIFDIPIYLHKKVSTIFIIIFSGLIKFFSILNILNNDEKKIYIKIIYGLFQ